MFELDSSENIVNSDFDVHRCWWYTSLFYLRLKHRALNFGSDRHFCNSTNYMQFAFKSKENRLKILLQIDWEMPLIQKEIQIQNFQKRMYIRGNVSKISIKFLCQKYWIGGIFCEISFWKSSKGLQSILVSNITFSKIICLDFNSKTRLG